MIPRFVTEMRQRADSESREFVHVAIDSLLFEKHQTQRQARRAEAADSYAGISSPSPSPISEPRGRWGTTDDFTTSFSIFLFSTAFWDLANSRPIHSLMLSSHDFFCLTCLLTPITVLCKMVLARPDERETRRYHFSLRLFSWSGLRVVRLPARSWHRLPRW